MKKPFALLFLALVVLAAVVLTRAALLKPTTVSVPPATPTQLDASGAVQRFIGAIQIPTESHYNQPPNAVAMQAFRDYLQKSFPLVHSTMQREVLPDGGLIFTWPGRMPGIDPVILMGHMDVVPVPAEDLPKWTHPPYSADLADGAIWGRGTLDDKIHVLSELEAAETLLAQGYTPARPILFCFGSDEENGGKYGAREIVALLKSRGVHAQFVLDEGGIVIKGVVPGVTQPLALVGIAEKGFVDLSLSTHGTGGHSSAPPPHTTIGRLAAALTRVEDHPFPASLPPVLEAQYTTLAPYMPFSRRIILANLWLFRPLVVYTGLKNPEQAGNYRTTTAEDMISGGFKDNALPPSAAAVINFRILPGETQATVTDRITRIVNDPQVTVANPNPDDARNPSPTSPTDSPAFATLSTTIHQLFPSAIVSPYLINAATDASWYTPLSPNVYRFLAVNGDLSMLTMIHGVNERVSPENYLKSVQFFTQLLHNIQ
jgi:carboxypeptidase PM20D1